MKKKPALHCKRPARRQNPGTASKPLPNASETLIQMPYALKLSASTLKMNTGYFWEVTNKIRVKIQVRKKIHRKEQKSRKDFSSVVKKGT